MPWESHSQYFTPKFEYDRTMCIPPQRESRGLCWIILIYRSHSIKLAFARGHFLLQQVMSPVSAVEKRAALEQLYPKMVLHYDTLG